MNWWSRLTGQEPSSPAGARPDLLVFEAGDWVPDRTGPHGSAWRDDLGNTLRVDRHDEPAPFLGHTGDADALRAFARHTAAARGASLVSADLVDIAGVSSLVVVVTQHGPQGSRAGGSITVPLAAGHLAIVVDAEERGAFGIREAVVSAHLLQRGDLDLSTLDPGGPAGQPIPGWLRDPYDAAQDRQTMCALSDDPRFDVIFPLDPLTRVRACLARIQATAKLGVGITPPSVPARLLQGPTTSPSPQVSLEAVASLCIQLGLYAEAERLLAHGSDELEWDDRDDTTRTGHRRLLLAFAREGQGRFADAEATFREAHALYARVHGDEHPDTARAACNVGRVLIAQGRHAEAEPLFRQARRIFEANGGTATDTGVAVNGLGLVHQSREELVDAIACFERAIALFEGEHGPHFPDIVSVLRNTATAWTKLGHTDKAAQALARADELERGAHARGGGAV